MEKINDVNVIREFVSTGNDKKINILKLKKSEIIDNGM